MLGRLKAAALTFLSFFSLHAGPLNDACKEALKENKLVLLTVEQDGCPYCKIMKREIFNADKYRERIDKNYIYLAMNSNDPDLPQFLRSKYIPTNFILSPKNLDVIDAYAGYQQADYFVQLLEQTYRLGAKHTLQSNS